MAKLTTPVNRMNLSRFILGNRPSFAGALASVGPPPDPPLSRSVGAGGSSFLFWRDQIGAFILFFHPQSAVTQQPEDTNKRKPIYTPAL